MARDFWPVVIEPKAKGPKYRDWGKKRLTIDEIHARFRQKPDSGVGVVLGPGRAPGGGWLIDLEGDGPAFEDSLTTFLGGEIIPTIGWSSTRGSHHLYVANGELLLKSLMSAGARDKGGEAPGKWELPELPDLELRVGAYGPDGTIKQFQSVVPPTPGTDGKPRTWNGVEDLAELPDAAYAFLEALAERKAIREADDPRHEQEAREIAERAWGGLVARSGATKEKRAAAFLEKVDGGVSGQHGSIPAFRAACKAGPGFDLDFETALRLLLTNYNPRCTPPWSEKEMRHKLEDAYRLETRPRGYMLVDRPKAGTVGGQPPVDQVVDLATLQTLSDEDLGIRRVSKIRKRRIEWFWPNRIVKDAYNLVAGEGKQGKSQVVTAIAARATDGGEWPDGSGNAPCGNVIFLSAEDDPERTIRPRLEAHGANLDKALVLEAKYKTPSKDGKKLVSFATFQDLTYFEAVLRRIANPVLLIADPLPSYMGRGVNDRRNSEVRQVLEPFIDLVASFGCTLIGVTHLGKSSDGRKAIHRVLDSIAYVNLARATHYVARDPNDAGRRLFMPGPGNYAPPDLGSLAFSLVAREILDDDGAPMEVAVPEFDGKAVDVDPDEIVSASTPRKKRGPSPSKSEAFARWLFEQLRGGDTSIHYLIERARSEDILASPNTKTPNPSLSPLYAAKDRIPAVYPGWHVEDCSIQVRMPLGKKESVSSHKAWRLVNEGQDTGNNPENSENSEVPY